MPLSAIIRATIGGVFKKTTDLSESSYPIKEADPIVLKSGTGNGRADLYFDDERTLAASATENLDFAGVLADAFGTALAAAKIKAIEIEAAAANTNDVLVGGAASNPFATMFGDASDVLKIQPGGRLVLAAPNAGYAVTAGTGDLLKITNGGAGTPVTYKIKIVAASA